MAAEQSQRYLAALRYAEEKHRGQLRIGGDPYITHPVAVAEILRDWGCGEELCIAGLFHDLLEDTDARDEQLLVLGSEEILRAVRLMTKKKGYVMAEYIAGIKADPMAFRVKAADRLHNLRCAFAADDTFKRKYIRETEQWYLDFCPEIAQAVKELADSLKDPSADRPEL